MNEITDEFVNDTINGAVEHSRSPTRSSSGKTSVAPEWLTLETLSSGGSVAPMLIEEVGNGSTQSICLGTAL